MSDVNEWIKERRRIHDAATEISEGDWFACRYQIGAGSDPGDPSEIVGTLNAKDYATAIVDAHNSFPAALSALEKVLELCDKVLAVKVEGASEGDASMAAMASVIQRAIEGTLTDE